MREDLAAGPEIVTFMVDGVLERGDYELVNRAELPAELGEGGGLSAHLGQLALGCIDADVCN